ALIPTEYMENTWNGCLINHLFTFRCVSFQCYHCDGKTKQFNAIIQHLILKHPENEMKIRKIINVNGTIKLITKNFSDVIPSEIEASGKKIVIQDQDSMTISIAQYLDSDVPHVSKCSKLDIDSNNEMKCRTTMDNNIEKENEIENKIENETTNEITNEMNDIIHGVAPGPTIVGTGGCPGVFARVPTIVGTLSSPSSAR
ncbi:unnamed protein product, partial [Owenia fusiformis]